jgi:hypothetical protein
MDKTKIPKDRIDIFKYGFWQIDGTTTEYILRNLKEHTQNLEIKNLEYFRGQLDKNLKIIIETIDRITNKKVKDVTEKVLYNFYYNRFLFYLTLDAVLLPKEYERDFSIRGVFLHYSKKDGYSIDRNSVKRWFAEEFTIPLILTTFTKTINSVWLRGFFDRIQKINKSQSNNNKLKPFEDFEDPEKKDIISKIKICRDVLLNKNDKRPYTLTRISKKMNERYSPIHYNTLRDKMIKHKIPTNIKKFTELYG